MKTEIWKAGRFKKINPSDPIDTSRNIHAFCVANGMRNALLKSQGGWYWISKNGEMNLIARTLYLISFDMLYALRNI